MTKIKCFWLYAVYISCLQFVATMRNEKPVAEKVWREPCTKHSRILNDCNWCWCNEQSRYSCHARVCNEVDMFGHFNDAIREIDVGMEGRGVWRTATPACNPGVHYQRDGLLCICDEEGNWPNPVCRDTFRVLYNVDVVNDVKSFKERHCTPLKLYLIGCNVCFCPLNGVPNPKYCTHKSCSEDDPVFNPKLEEKAEVSDIYAPCNVDKKYRLGCQNCVCLRNNRLLCDKCAEEAPLCRNRQPGEIFSRGCNLCHCDEDGLLYCSVKRCLEGLIRTPDVIDESEYSLVKKPRSQYNCVGGTKFKVNCRTCYCYAFPDFSLSFCDMNFCSEEMNLRNDCVEGTAYVVDCLICQCGLYNGTKMEVCQENPNCKKLAGRGLPNLYDLQGYCEPLHLYKKDCNTCECLTDGKTVRCSTQICQKPQNRNKTAESVSVDVVPIVKNIGNCPKGRSFKIDCNVCFCLSNGDVLCTTAKCRNGRF